MLGLDEATPREGRVDGADADVAIGFTGGLHSIRPPCPSPARSIRRLSARRKWLPLLALGGVPPLPRRKLKSLRALNGLSATPGIHVVDRKRSPVVDMARCFEGHAHQLMPVPGSRYRREEGRAKETADAATFLRYDLRAALQL